MPHYAETSYLREGDQRRPLAFQVGHFDAGSPLEPCSRQPEWFRSLGLAGTSISARILDNYHAEESLHVRASRVFNCAAGHNGDTPAVAQDSR